MRSRHRRDLGELKERIEQRRFEAATRHLAAPQKAWHEALALASSAAPHEVFELYELVRAGKAAGREIAPEFVPIGGYWLNGIDPELDPRGTELYELIMRLSAPTLAADIRVRRCCLWRELVRRGSVALQPETDLWNGTREPITDLGEARRILAERGHTKKGAGM
jgi:hypothetical protein